MEDMLFSFQNKITASPTGWRSLRHVSFKVLFLRKLVLRIDTLCEMLCVIWYHLYNLKNVKTTHGGMFLLVTLLHGCFTYFKIVQMIPNCATDHIFISCQKHVVINIVSYIKIILK